MARVLSELSSGGASGLLGGDPSECAEILGVDGVAISLDRDNALYELVWSTEGTSEALEDVQYTLGEGPGVDTATSGSMVMVSDLEQERADRWPALLPAATGLGVRSVFCLPLRIGGVSLGVLTAQRASPGPMAAHAVDDVLILAATATAVLIGGGQRQRFTHAEPTSHLHRAAVHQATGMISVQANVTLTEALVLLRAHAYRYDRALLDVARDVVARNLHFRDTGGGTAPSSGAME
ncbi:GAF and ANTAR domain-containing protein [Streptomyces sp. NPDC051561]|uniref:GAF and ANTAR domain-containing protein n=1 Tax=Streptomyces sp. NPDC051561 TaxID=3365658 RepID=UPI0037961DEA